MQELLFSLATSDEAGGDTSDDSSGDEFYTSLDLEANDIEESHYLGSGAFAHLTMDNSDSPSSSNGVNVQANQLPYRQVADPKHPVFFLRNPSKVYGYSNAAYAGDKAYTSTAELLKDEGSDVSQRLLQTFVRCTLPAVPIFNKVRLEATCYGWQGAGQFPHAIMVGIMAHTSILVPDLRRHCKELWAILLHLLDNEFRQPRLQTLQLALLDIYGRPHLNQGGNHPALCRALGAAQLLGLHRDCAKWKLPKWERSIRKRIWWSLFVADKWNAFVYGRPCNIPSSSSSVPCPTLADDDWNGMSVENDRNLVVFVAGCRLSVVLETLLPLSTHEGSDNSQEIPQLVRTSGAALMRVLDGLEELRYSGVGDRNKDSGVASFQLNYFGVELLIGRMSLDSLARVSIDRAVRTMSHLLKIVNCLVQFVSSLDIDDYNGYWSPWSSTHLSHALSLLLRMVLKLSDVPTQTFLYKQTWDMAHSLVTAVQISSVGMWEVAETALPRMRILVCSMPDLPECRALKHLLVPSPQSAHDDYLLNLPDDLTMLLPDGMSEPNTWDWLSDMDFWTQAGLDNAFSS